MSQLIQITQTQHTRIIDALTYALVVANNQKAKLNNDYNGNNSEYELSAVQLAIVETDREILRLELLLEELNNLV